MSDDELSRARRSKLAAIDELGKAGIRTVLVCTVQAGVNEHEYGRLVEFGIERPWITGVSFQPTTYTGRYYLPAELEQRVTFPDIIQGIAAQTAGRWHVSDFLPLPCAHPNAHSLAYAYRSKGDYIPLTRFIDIENHLDLLANGITFDRPKASRLIGEFLSRQGCGGECCDASDFVTLAAGGPREDHAQRVAEPRMPRDSNSPGDDSPKGLANEFFARALAEDLSPEDVFRITTTSFMDAFNFDTRQLMKSCVHHILPSGHIIPFSAYNVLYRDGHVPLPKLSMPGKTLGGITA